MGETEKVYETTLFVRLYASVNCYHHHHHHLRHFINRGASTQKLLGGMFPPPNGGAEWVGLPLHSRLRGLGEHSELLQRGPGTMSPHRCAEGPSEVSYVTRGTGKSRDLLQRGPAGNAFWRILKATECSFLHHADALSSSVFSVTLGDQGRGLGAIAPTPT